VSLCGVGGMLPDASDMLSPAMLPAARGGLWVGFVLGGVSLFACEVLWSRLSARSSRISDISLDSTSGMLVVTVC